MRLRSIIARYRRNRSRWIFSSSPLTILHRTPCEHGAVKARTAMPGFDWRKQSDPHFHALFKVNIHEIVDKYKPCPSSIRMHSERARSLLKSVQTLFAGYISTQTSKIGHAIGALRRRSNFQAGEVRRSRRTISCAKARYLISHRCRTRFGLYSILGIRVSM